jgi:hypothetical protein
MGRHSRMRPVAARAAGGPPRGPEGRFRAPAPAGTPARHRHHTGPAPGRHLRPALGRHRLTTHQPGICGLARRSGICWPSLPREGAGGRAAPEPVNRAAHTRPGPPLALPSRCGRKKSQADGSVQTALSQSPLLSPRTASSPQRPAPGSLCLSPGGSAPRRQRPTAADPHRSKPAPRDAAAPQPQRSAPPPAPEPSRRRAGGGLAGRGVLSAPG